MPVIECGSGGHKWGEEGVCFTGPKSKEKAEAVGRAIQAQQNDYVADSLQVFSAKVDDSTGFLTAPVTLARVGVQKYYGYELGIPDRAMDLIGVYRPAEEVFADDSVKTFINLVSTDDHPADQVTVKNVKDLQVGTVSSVTADESNGVLKGILTITDEREINKVKNGKVEVSVGYSHDLIPESGVFNGEAYDFVQRNIHANHLAIVNAGRCGSACRIITDHRKENSMVITIDGIEYNSEDTQLAQAVKKMQERHDAEMNKKEEEMSKKDEEMEELKKKKEASDAKADALTKDQLSTDAINKMVTARAELLSTAKTILGDSMPECTDCPREIKSAVVDSVLGMSDLSGKDDAYIDGLYEYAVDKSSKDKTAEGSLKKDFAKDKEIQVTRDSIRKEHNKKMGLEV